MLPASKHLVWCEVDTSILAQNLAALRLRTGPGVLIAPAVKANAYGHGIGVASHAFLAGGADWLCVHSVEEAHFLRTHGFECPILVVGYVARWELAEVRALGCRMVVYNREIVEEARHLPPGPPLRVHIKLETGNNRQGLLLEEALSLAAEMVTVPALELEGLSTHFANVEDTTDHEFATRQLRRFEEGVSAFRAAGYAVPVCHVANSAATLLWSHSHKALVRPGIACYGMWPSPETLVSTVLGGQAPLPLKPALTWQSRVAQLKPISSGEFVGYGCTYMATHSTRLAIVPVGYYDGYDRRLSNLAHVLVRGHRAPVRGRVCMDFIMVDVTDIPEVGLEDEVVLLGRQGDERISAEQLGNWMGTINYEVTTRIGAHIPRVAVG